MTTQKNGSSKIPRFQTAGKIRRDGLVLDLLRAPASPKRTNLVAWDGRALQTGPEIIHGGRIYEPPDVDSSFFQALRLPTRVGPPEPARELFDSVHNLLRVRLGQLEVCTKELTFAIFASWFSPVLSMAPIVFITAPPGSPKNLVLQLLGAMCRRPLRLVGVTRADLRALPYALQPTLLLDEPDLRPATEAILLASTRRGSHIRNGHNIIDPYGMKFICSEKLPRGTALETEAVRITLTPAAAELPPLDPGTVQKIGEEFQSRLLGYFLRNCRTVEIPDFEVGHLTLPMQDIARALGTAIVGDQKLQSEVPRLLSDQDEQFRADLAISLDSVVDEALIFFAHRAEGAKIRALSVAKEVCAIYKGRGLNREVSAESVGWALRRLGIPSGRIDRAGNGVELTPSTCRLVHRLGMSYGVRALQSGFRDGCRYCEELK